MTDADRLRRTMTHCAIELASLIGLPGEPAADRQLNADHVPHAGWNAATIALEYLLVGAGILDSATDERPPDLGCSLDEELAALLGGNE
jgi:hypothetical protein